jgi:hypothetical protein
MAHLTRPTDENLHFTTSPVSLGTGPARYWSTAEKGSNPSVQLRGPAALANQAGVTEDGLTLPPSWCHRCQARAMFTLTGRAPDVP